MRSGHLGMADHPGALLELESAAPRILAAVQAAGRTVSVQALSQSMMLPASAVWLVLHVLAGLGMVTLHGEEVRVAAGVEHVEEQRELNTVLVCHPARDMGR